jgi:hypothetical protein
MIKNKPWKHFQRHDLQLDEPLMHVLLYTSRTKKASRGEAFF